MQKEINKTENSRKEYIFGEHKISEQPHKFEVPL